MAINPAIILQGQQMQVPDFLGMQEKALRLSDLVRARQEDDAARNAFAFQPSGEVDRNVTLRNLAGIDPRLAMKQSYQWQMGDLGMQKATRENERIQGMLAKQQDEKRRTVQSGALQEYFRTLQTSGDERFAQQAAQDFLIRAGLRGEQFSPDMSIDMGGGGGDEGDGGAEFQDVGMPADDAMGGFMTVASPGARPAPMPNQGQRPAPQATPLPSVEPDSMPDAATRPGRAGPDYNWQKAYAFTRLQFPKANPLAMTTVLDWRTGQPIVNEPLVGARERVAAAGRTTVTAAGGNIELGKPAQTKVDEAILNAGARLQRLNEIESIMKPEYLQIGTMAKGGWASIKDKLGFASPQEKKLVADMATAYSTAFEDFNKTIAEASGMTVTDAEAARMKKQMPAPPTGPLDWSADGPSEYFAKLQQNTKMLKLAEARLLFIKRNGLSLEDGARKVPLEQMPTFMNRRGAEIESDLKKKFPNMKEAERDREVKQILSKEFGFTR